MAEATPWIYTGDSVIFNVAVTDSAGEDVDVSDVQTAEYGIFDKFGSSKVDKRLGFGITVATNIITVEILPEDTADLPAGLYVHELEIIDSDSKVHTVLQGEIELKRDYVKREAP